MYKTQKKSYFPGLVMLFVFSVILYLYHLLSDIMTPFVIGIILAYFLNPLVNKLSNKMPRMLACLLIVFGTGIVIMVFIAFLVPVLLQQIYELIDKMPVVLTWLNENSDKISLPAVVQTKIEAIQNKLNFRDFFSIENLDQIWKQNNETLKAMILKLSAYVKQTGSSIVSLLYNLLMLPVTLLYFLYVWPSLLVRLKKTIPRRYYHSVMSFMGDLDIAFSQFIRGQFVVMMIMGFIYGIGLALVGLKNGFVIGFMTGFLVFVPYLGFTVGFILATLAVILQYGDIWHLLGVWVVFGIGQTLESFIITPKLIGERIGLSPILVIFVLLAFGSLFGFVGMLIALPVSAIFVVIANKISSRYYSSEFYLEE